MNLLQSNVKWESLDGKVWQIYSFQAYYEKVCQMNRSAKRLLIVSINLDSSSLVNHSKIVKGGKIR